MNNVEKAREVRLWITKVIFPIGVFLALSPTARDVIATGAKSCKKYITSKLPKKK